MDGVNPTIHGYSELAACLSQRMDEIAKLPKPVYKSNSPAAKVFPAIGGVDISINDLLRNEILLFSAPALVMPSEVLLGPGSGLRAI